MQESENKAWRQKPRNRGANTDWREVFYVLYRLHQFQEFGLVDVIESAEKFGLDIKRESLRVKLAQYVSKSILEKPKRGKYKISEFGFSYFDLANSTKKELLSTNSEEEPMTEH